MRLARFASTLLGLSLIVATANSASAKCDPSVDPDKSDIANARAAVAANCDCAGAADRATYKKCAAQQIDATIVNRGCRSRARKCASQSICGRPGYVTCCRTVNGKNRCNVMRSATCARKNGTPGYCSSCCDACPLYGSGPSCSNAPTQCCLRTVTCGPFEMCQVMTNEECSAAGGFNVGQGDCSEQACSHATTTTPPSACCVSGTCSILGLCECFQAGGNFTFSGTCSPNPCPTTTLPSVTTTSSITTTTTSGGGEICCTRSVTCGPFDTCSVIPSGSTCGGINLGPGDCSGPAPCAHATTTTPPFACCYGAGQCVNTGLCECGQLGGQTKFFQFCGGLVDPCATTTTTLP